MREVSERMRDEEGNLKRKTKAWGGGEKSNHYQEKENKLNCLGRGRNRKKK